MGEFKGFMKYEKQSLSELSLVERLKNHDAFQQRFHVMKHLFKAHDVWIVGHHSVKQVFLSVETIGCPIGNYVLSGMIWFIARISKLHINV